MYKIFFAIYDDASKRVPDRFFYKNPYTVYRTANMGFVEELSGKGFEPTAVLLEEDIEAILDGSYTSDSLTESDIQFLVDFKTKWELPQG